MIYKNQDYAYIVGRLRALETRLMNANLVERMIDAPTAQDAFRVLNDVPLISGSIGEYTVDDFQKVLSGGLKKMAELFRSMAPNPEVMNYLWLKYDFHNLKVVLKARLTGRGYADVEHALIDMGNRSKSEWETYLLTGKIKPLTDGMNSTIQDATIHYNNNEDAQSVDLIVDRHFVEEMLLVSQKIGSTLLIKYLKRLIDFNNLRTFIRCEILKKDKKQVNQFLVNGGNISVSVFLSSFEKGHEGLLQVLSRKIASDDLVYVLNAYSNEKTLLTTEKKIAELQQNFMDESKKMSFGTESVFAFFWKFENHLHVIRAILVGKLNGLPLEDIKKHVLSI